MNSKQIPASIRLPLEELKQALVRLYGEGLKGVYLYGSYARGDFSPDSDVDLLIALEGNVNPYEEIDRVSEIVSEISLRYDVLIGEAIVVIEDDGLRIRPLPIPEGKPASPSPR